MTANEDSTKRGRSERFESYLHLYVLASFAVAQPLFELLSRDAEFLVAHRVPPAGILLLPLVLTFAAPSVLVGLELVARLFGQRPRATLHAVLVFGLFALIFLPPIKRAGLLPGWGDLLASASIAAAATWAYTAFRPGRLFVSVLSPVILLFPILFLAQRDVTQLAFPDSPLPERLPSARAAEHGAKTPFVMVVFDEFSVASMMNDELEIDPIRFPRFAALAQDSIWFRNTRCSSPTTTVAVPSILSGRLPRKQERLPTLQEYPQNLFTLLAPAYPQVVVFESPTSLCPPQLQSHRPPAPEDAGRTYADLVAVWLHVVAPQQVVGSLPPVEHNWSGFWEEDPSEAGPHSGEAGVFLEFIDRIRPEPSPGFWFLHVVLPHVPWAYLPSGKRYMQTPGEIFGLEGTDWQDDEWAVIQGYQRYLSQAVYADVLLGKLIDKLRDSGIYEQALVVITADHGIAFVPGSHRKTGPPGAQSDDVRYVPLFLKLPLGSRRGVVDRKVASVDILPTVAECLGVEVPEPVDGRSLVDSWVGKAAPEADGRAQDGALLRARKRSVERLRGWVAPAVVGDPAVRVGAYRSHLGASLESFDVEATDVGSIVLDDEGSFERIDLQSDFLPCLVTGSVIGESSDAPLGRDIAIFVNGKLGAVTRCLGSEATVTDPRRPQERAPIDALAGVHAGGRRAFFSALLPETSLAQGRNELAAFFVTGPEDRPLLLSPLTEGRGPTLIRSPDGSQESLSFPGGALLPIEPGAFRGQVEGETKNASTVLDGWAIDVAGGEVAEDFLIFLDGEHLGLSRMSLARHQGPAWLTLLGVERAGFRIRFPASFLDVPRPDLRIFAVSSRGYATELGRRSPFPWFESPSYRLEGDRILGPDGHEHRLVPRTDALSVDSAQMDERFLDLAGSATELERAQVPERILVFHGDRCVFSSPMNGVGPRSGAGSLPDSLPLGFRYRLPLRHLDGEVAGRVRLYALRGSLAWELGYGAEAAWLRGE